ncbi:MAG: NADH-quinone oxidoreductase subunit L [Planctomycetes bacterium]|nr:NADH-quinone oxidoreductase subunit L [Planctomycetota bacterium]
MQPMLSELSVLLVPATAHGGGAASHGAAAVSEAIAAGPWFAMFIPLFPLLAAVVCGLFAFTRRYDPKRSKIPGWCCVLGLLLSFVTSVAVISRIGHDTLQVTIFEWIASGSLQADFAFYLDPLTSIMLLVVTGISTLVALYASEYMSGDRGYARFFAFIGMFVFAMTCLILADNLVLLYLGWEGVGLCSYLLIGFYYEKPSAVAAAKKAFIVNRIGDLGFALGIMLTYMEFGTVEFAPLFQALSGHSPESVSGSVQIIPFLLMLGAFGKSAQLPLYVWLPDAMEGPTPVSALIHAATMVTAGVYMIARLAPLFVLSPYALPTVAWIGGLTALFAATIGMAQYDMKRIFAYSTVSQLGYMFMGIGVLSATGAVFHLFTHAFFKALLFLGSGAVMHGFAGQLDIRRISGLRKVKGWGVVTWTMLVGCLALAGFPFLSGFFSKDTILAQAFVTPGYGFTILGFMGLFTALLTAYYTFRLFFRVFLGPQRYEPGDEHHADDDGGHGHEAEHFHPHAPGWAINLVLTILALGAAFSGYVGVFGGEEHGWFGGMMHASTGNAVTESLAASHGADGHAAGEAAGFWADPHKWMMAVSAVIGLVGILIAWYFHLLNRQAADRLKERVRPIAVLLENKWYVDEGYDILIRKPLRMAGYVFYLIGDTIIINGLVALGGAIPRLIGSTIKPMQRGILHGYGLGMAAGLCAVLAIMWWLIQVGVT